MEMDLEKEAIAVVENNKVEEEKRDWTKMPEEIMEEFMKKLTAFEEKVRFGNVCKAWNPIAPNKPYLWSPETPWLIDNDHTSPHFKIYRFSDRKVFNVQKPSCIFRAEIVGSLMGWLFLRTSRPKSDKLTLLTPFSNYRLDLPTSYYTTWIPPLHPASNRIVTRSLAFSISTCCNMNPTTIAMVNTDGCLAWCNPGDKVWKFHRSMDQHDYCCYGNLLLHDDKLYAVDLTGRNVDIFRFEDGNKKKNLVQVGTTTGNGDNKMDDDDDPFYVDAYMVECGGRVLVLRRYYLRYVIRPTSDWVVMELNERCSPPRLEVVRNLGDYILFAGDTSCESVAAHLCPDLSPNCIYFTSFLRNSLVSYLSEFCLARSRITRRAPLNKPTLLYGPLWLMPRLPFHCHQHHCLCSPMIMSHTTKKIDNRRPMQQQPPSSTAATPVVGLRRSKRKLSTTTTNAAKQGDLN